MMDVEVTGQAREVTERSVELQLSLDPLYNLIVCNHCCVALPWEWVRSHLKEQHAIETTDEEVSDFLGLQDSALTVQQVKDWRESVVVGKAVHNIPVVNGFRCNLCNYSVAARKGMKNHFSEIHKGYKRAKYSEDCKVQLVFHGSLRKYIQVEEDEDMDMDLDEGADNTEWKTAIDTEFAESMANLQISSTNERGNLRLKNVFIAKTRWDAMVDGLDLQAVVKSAAAPLVNDELHGIILCGRRYIHKTCDALDKGSVIVKRVLMSGGYVNIQASLIVQEWVEERHGKRKDGYL
jgi:hypothetical protein